MSWSYSYTPEIWPALITLALAIFLGSYTWRLRNIPAAKPFIIACVLVGLWTLGVILELSAVEFPTKVFWVKFQAIWQLPLATVMTCFVFQYAGLGRWLTRRIYVLLFLLPLASVLLMVTNNFHHLIWTGFRMDRYVIESHGRLYWVLHSYIYILSPINFVVLVWLAISSPAHRLPVAIIVFGQIFARVGYTLDKFQVIGPGESVLLILGVVAVAYAVAFLRFHTIDPVTASRKAMLQQMREGLFVLDLQGHIVDVNPVGAAISGSSENSLRGKPITEGMPIDSGLLKHLENQEIGQTEITIEKDNSVRQYNLNLTRLRGRHGEVIGRLLLLHDVTEQKRAQVRILEQQNVVATLKERERLAREIHDGIGQTLGYVSMQVQTALKWLHKENSEKAESLLGRIVKVAKDAHADVRESIISLTAGSSDQKWSFIQALKKYIDRFQSNYGIRTEIRLSDGIGDHTFESKAEVQLFRVIQEAMTNCRKHSGAHMLKVSAGLNGSTAYITVTDDGRGFDVGQLEHDDGRHFGLTFMKERMAQIGGSLNIHSVPGGGTVLKLEVPVRERLEQSK